MLYQCAFFHILQPFSCQIFPSSDINYIFDGRKLVNKAILKHTSKNVYATKPRAFNVELLLNKIDKWIENNFVT